MSVTAQAWAWQQDVPASTKSVLLALADHADDEGICWPGVKSVAQKCRLSHEAIRYHLRVLRRKGLLFSEERNRPDGSQTSNLYRLPVKILTPPYQAIEGGVSSNEEGAPKGLIPHLNHQGTIIEPTLSTKEYIHTLRGIPGWNEKGEPHLESLLKWVKSKDCSDETMERAAIGLASVQKKTLMGYTNLASALQKRINNGYDDPAQKGSNNGTAKGYTQKAPGAGGERIIYTSEAARLGLDPNVPRELPQLP